MISRVQHVWKASGKEEYTNNQDCHHYVVRSGKIGQKPEILIYRYRRETDLWFLWALVLLETFENPLDRDCRRHQCLDLRVDGVREDTTVWYYHRDDDVFNHASRHTCHKKGRRDSWQMAWSVLDRTSSMLPRLLLTTHCGEFSQRPQQHICVTLSRRYWRKKKEKKRVCFVFYWFANSLIAHSFGITHILFNEISINCNMLKSLI